MHCYRAARKRLFCFTMTGIIACLTAVPVSAQFAIGIEGGFTKNHLFTNNANRAFNNIVPYSGFSAGIPVTYTLNPWLAVAADLSLVQKNYRQERSSFYSGVYQNNINTYIQLPLMAHFMFGRSGLTGFVNTGIYMAYWASAKRQGVMTNILDAANTDSSSKRLQHPYAYNEAVPFDPRRDRRIEWGLAAGLGAAYLTGKRYQLFAEARILYGVTDQQKNYMIHQVPRYNTTIGLQAGMMYRFVKIKRRKE